MPTTHFPTALLPYKFHLKYPLARTTTYRTTVQQFMGDQEVRFVSQLPVSKLTLTYNDIDLASVNILKSFFESQTGASTSEFDLALDMPAGSTVVYDHLVFDTDTFSATNTKANLWSVKLPLRQTRAS